MSSLQRLQRLTASLPFVTVSHCEPITGDSIWHSVAPALGMRRPFNLLLYPLILLFFWPRYSISREWKTYALQHKKYKNQAGINLTPPPSSQNYYCYCYWYYYSVGLCTVDYCCVDNKSTTSFTTNRANPTNARIPFVRFAVDLLYNSPTPQRRLSTRWNTQNI